MQRYLRVVSDIKVVHKCNWAPWSYYGRIVLIKGQFEERLQWILATLNVNCNVKSMIWKENTVNNKALVWRFTNDFSTRLQNSETRSPGVFAVNVNLARGFFVWLCFYQPQRSRWWPSPHSSHSLCLLQTGSLSLGSFIFRPPSIPPVVSMSLFFKCETLENWNTIHVYFHSDFVFIQCDDTTHEHDLCILTFPYSIHICSETADMVDGVWCVKQFCHSGPHNTSTNTTSGGGRLNCNSQRT